MEPISLKKCKEDGCNHLATKIGQKQFDYCLQHLKSEDYEELTSLFSKGIDLQFSVLDGRNSNGYPFTTLPCNPKKEHDLRGSIFVAIDFSSADFECVDFAFCWFIACDLRRARLYNSSLRWTCFNRTLIRQTDINNSDCRWMQAQSSDHIADFTAICTQLTEKYKKAPSKYLHIIGRNDSEFFFRRFGYEPDDEEKELFKQQKFEELAKAVKGIESSDSPTSCHNKEGILSLKSILQQVKTSVPETDWSGAAIRDSDLAYSSFDYTLAVEVVFDGSDLHEASFRHATLHRSSFLNVSFSRCDLSTSITHFQDNLVISRFKEAKMEGCILDGTNLERLFFEGTIFNNASMKGAFLRNAVFFACEMRNITADDVVGENAFFLASNLSGASFIGSILNNTRFWWDFSKCLPIKLKDKDQKDLKSKYQQLLNENRVLTNLIATNFQAAELEKVVFNNCMLQGALFQAANLSDANLKDTQCLGCQFNACNINGVNFTGSDLTSCSFQDAGTLDTPPTFEKTILTDAILSGMDLTGAKFIDSTLDGIDLSNCRLSDVEITIKSQNKYIQMSRASLRNSVLNGAQFKKVDLSSTDLSFSVCREDNNNSKVKFYECILSMASLEGVDIKNVTWFKSDLRKANLSFANLEDAIFEHCHLEDSSFKGANLNGIEILEPKDLDGADFSDATIISSEKIKSNLTGARENNNFFAALLFDGTSIHDFIISNIFMSAASFKSAALLGLRCSNVVFAHSDFSSSKFEANQANDTHFFYCNFHLARIDFKKHNDLNVFLGCRFDEANLPKKPDNMVFADCSFYLSSFLGHSDKAKNWQKALFVQSHFEELKYYAIKEASSHSVDYESQNGLSFESFIKQSRLTIENKTELLKAARNLSKRFSDLAERLEVLIPEVETLLIDKGYSLIRTLCREFRKDFLRQGLSELASEAYVKEMNCELKLHALRYGASLNEKPWLKKLKLEDWLKCSISCAVDCPTILIYGLLFVVAGLINWSSGYVSGSFLLILPLLVLLKNRGIRLFLTKHIYNYGESVSKMLWAALVAIVFFTILYYGFVPTINGNWRLCSEGSQENCMQLKQAIFSPAFDSDPKTITGCLKQNEYVVTQSTDFSEKIKNFFTCFYFSGVTFTTLGYGDISPQGLVRYLSMIEAGLGAFLIALFVFSFTRRNALR